MAIVFWPVWRLCFWPSGAAVFLARVATMSLVYLAAMVLALEGAMLQICVEPVLHAHVMDGYWPVLGTSIACIWHG